MSITREQIEEEMCERCGRPKSDPAKPEPGPWFRCSYDSGDEIDAAFCGEVAAAYQRGRAEAVTWRPMSEAPKDGTYVILLDTHGHAHSATFHVGEWCCSDYTIQDARAWLPIPLPPLEPL